MSIARQQNESAAQFEGRVIQRDQQAGLSAVERAAVVARQAAERQKELAASAAASRTVTLIADQPEPFTPDERELRQLLAVKLRTLACEVEGIDNTRPANAAEIRRGVDRLRDIAGAME